ncbi:MAG: GNAT family N-acetyltransferase [Oscillospiraceae bacterium]|nr:GNAT family N-acetyltransferase [Oscillospiraceae bacterium]
MTIRLFKNDDAQETSEIIARTLRMCNSADYPRDYIEENILSHSPQVLIRRASEGHFYVVCDDNKIIGCGGIAGYWGSKTESIILTVFVAPEYQKKGIGAKIIETLEKDEYFLRAQRVEIPASVTACEFYKKMGYIYVNGITTPDDEGCIRLEKKCDA